QKEACFHTDSVDKAWQTVLRKDDLLPGRREPPEAPQSLERVQARYSLTASLGGGRVGVPRFFGRDAGAAQIRVEAPALRPRRSPGAKSRGLRSNEEEASLADD